MSLTTRAHGIDISKYDQFFYPEKATGQLDFVFQRISYGTTRDELFSTLAPEVAKVGVRMGYHYLSSGISYKTQADYFLAYIAGYNYHVIACDFEAAFNTMNTAFAKLAWDWIQYVKLKTGKPVILYTSLSLYNSYIYPSQAIYNINWNTVPLWQAQWWNTPNPDGTPTNPTGRTAGWDFWQYTNRGDGSQYGCAKRTEFDLDVFNGTLSQLKQKFGIGEVPQSDVTTTPHAGMKHVTGARNGWKFELFDIDPAYFEFELVSTPNLETVRSVYNRKHATLAISAGEWNDRDPSNTATYLKPENFTVSNGQLVQYRLEAVPSLMITDTKQIIIDHKVQTANILQAFSGLRYIVGPLTDSSGWSTEGHARTSYGRKANGNMIIVLSEGKYPNQGLTLFELRAVMQQYGAEIAADFAGGGDAGGVLDEVDLIKPENIVNGVNVYRALPMTFCIYAKDITMPTTRYEATAIGDNTKLRPNHNTVTDFNPIRAFKAGTVFYGDVLWIADATNKDTSQYIGDKWMQLTTGEWVAIIHRGVAYCTLKDNGVTPPPTADWIVSTTQELASGSVVTTLWNSGKVEKYIVP